MNYKHIIAIIVAVVVGVLSAWGQNAATAILERDSIIIGEQIELNIEATAENASSVIFPKFKDTIVKGIEVLRSMEAVEDTTATVPTIDKKYIITSFDTGMNVIPTLPVKFVTKSDTTTIETNVNVLIVKPFVLLDTIPVDTIYSNTSGFVVFGKNGFKREIEQSIPDSIRQTMSSDSLAMLKQQMYTQLLSMFSSQVTQHAGIYDQTQIEQIAESSAQKLFIVDKSGILEDFIAAGSVDTIFVQEYQSVTQGMPLFTLYRIKDIEENLLETPFNWDEFWYYTKLYLRKYWWILLLVLAVVATLLYFFKYRKKEAKPLFHKVRMAEPPDIVAMRKLEQIRKEKIWSKGLDKEFHVQISDVIREYIAGRFGIYAVEMTTSDILAETSTHNDISNDDNALLKQILETADAVKFAKYKALQNENDLSIQNAVAFVEHTKEVINPDEKVNRVDPMIEITTPEPKDIGDK